MMEFDRTRPGQFTLDSEEALHFNQEDAIVWVEPLDGLTGLLNNDREEITNNIGKISKI